jgi:hypothetical protein
VGRPAAAGEDTALRALRGGPCRLRSRVSDEGGQYGDQGTVVIATAPRRAASAPCGPQARLAGSGQSACAKSPPCTCRSGNACSAVLWGAKPARRGGRKPTPGGQRSVWALKTLSDKVSGIKAEWPRRATLGRGTAREPDGTECRDASPTAQPLSATKGFPIHTQKPCIFVVFCI